MLFIASYFNGRCRNSAINQPWNTYSPVSRFGGLWNANRMQRNISRAPNRISRNFFFRRPVTRHCVIRYFYSGNTPGNKTARRACNIRRARIVRPYDRSLDPSAGLVAATERAWLIFGGWHENNLATIGHAGTRLNT